MTRLIFKHPEEAGLLESIAEKQGWEATTAVEASEHAPLEVIWATADGKSAVHYTEDHHVGFVYLLLEGAHVDELIGLLSEAFDFWSEQEIFDLVGPDADGEVVERGVALAALAAPPKPTAEYLALFELGLSHADPEIRAQTIEALAYPAWPDLAPRLRVIAASDTDARVRERAQTLTDAIKGGEGQ